jgi:hypothetical protein
LKEQKTVATDNTPATTALRRGRRATWGSLATHHPSVSAAPTLNTSDGKEYGLMRLPMKVFSDETDYFERIIQEANPILTHGGGCN